MGARKKKGLGCGCSDAPPLRGVSMTYGQLPPLDDYYAAFASHVGPPLQQRATDVPARYKMKLNTRDERLIAPFIRELPYGVRIEADGSLMFNANDLYNVLASMIRSNREDAANFASAVLQTLGFEWV